MSMYILDMVNSLVIKEIAITAGEDKIILCGETIIINTGAVAIKPNIDGIDTANRASIIAQKSNNYPLNQVH